MAYLDNSEVKKILNLRGSDLIQPAIAERQLEVIRKGFNYLHQPENNALYIADEVGLGKTYIALGIASLMRHFSSTPGSYQDLIFVPKENLQNKWAKEIRQFIRNNYLLFDNRVKSVIGIPVGSISIKDSLESISSDIPGYHIYRNSSLSFGLQYNSPKALRDNLLSRLASKVSRDYFNQADALGYLYADNKTLLKRFYAYLLSIDNPFLELLIVDEGHNFKYGLGESDDDEVSDRNTVVSRFLGLKKNSEEDIKIFNDFPELKKLVKPKVQKLVVLSATPKTASLLELKRQFDCFLSSHILSTAKVEKDVEEKLNQFLIRGKMEYELGDNRYSRNQCRQEHRRGNVVKMQGAARLQIMDNEQSLVMGLLQYNTIKYLNGQHNATFELGMLAGFETFKLDQQKKVNDQVYEETRTRKIRTSQDEDVLSGIINSYKDEFGVLPPHPKQDAIVEAIFQQMRCREKSLVFVRRVASAYELERRLLDKWEYEVVYKELKSKWSFKMKSKELEALLSAYETNIENRSLSEKLDNILGNLTSKMIALPKTYPVQDKNGKPYNEEAVKAALYYIYQNNKLLEGGHLFFDFLVKQVSLENFKSEFLEIAHQLIIKSQNDWVKRLGKEDESPFDEDEDESYFFHSYFRQPSNRFFRKSRIYQTDWFDLNFYLINKHFKIASFNPEPLKRGNINAKDVSDLKEVQEIFLKHINSEDFQEVQIFEEEFPNSLVSKRTLITELLLGPFVNEFSHFLKRITLISKQKSDIISEIKTLVTIIKSTIRNGIGFLPLYIADSAKKGETISNFIRMITDQESCFYDVIIEVKTIINDYELLQAVNFPEKDNQRDIESKLIYQSPVKGMSGVKKNKGKVAAQFRMPGYPYVLVTTDIFREGEDLHTYCQNIYHYGIAWNCSDMEQRTGRIDRINSFSNREMVKIQANNFEQRVHVFYPYLEKTIEVNQVNKLFNSINAFTEAFDIVGSLKEDGIASIKSAIETMPNKIDSFLKSKYEHDSFIGYIESGNRLIKNPRIGYSQDVLEHFLSDLCLAITSGAKFYLKPEVKYEEYKIIGDFDLEKRKNRRGPFRVLLLNDTVPGQFIVEVSSYLFKASSKVQKGLREMIVNQQWDYKLIDIDDYHALARYYSIKDLNAQNVYVCLNAVVNLADEFEEIITNGQDTIVFG